MKNKSKLILFPLMRDIKTIPPTISFLNYLAERGYNIVHFTYFTNVQFEYKNISVIKISKEKYPIDLMSRIIAKSRFYWGFYRYFIKNKNNIDAIWLGAWDIIGIDKIKGNIPLHYQFHELEEQKYKYCRKSDSVIVPEENRGWITFFQAKLKRKPLLLPNIPFYNKHNISEDSEILELQKQGKTVVLYSGLIDNKKRNLPELISAFKFLPENFVLVIIPSFVKVRNDLNDLKKIITDLELEKRVLFFDSRIPPRHLDTMATADIGIGFYSPTSLNNVYAAPNRIYEFINNGTPVVLPDFPTFKALSKEFPYAVNTVNPASPKDIAEVINKILENKRLMKQSISSFKETKGDYRYYADQIEKEIFKKYNTNKIPEV